MKSTNIYHPLVAAKLKELEETIAEASRRIAALEAAFMTTKPAKAPRKKQASAPAPATPRAPVPQPTFQPAVAAAAA